MELNMQQQDELIAKRKEINKKISVATEKEEISRLQAEKDDIDQDLSKLRFQADKNNKKFAEIKNSKDDSKISGSKISRYSDEELRTRCFRVSAMISKCNMVATNLMKGLSINSIQVKLEGWQDKKFTSKTPLPLSRAEKIKAEEKQQDSEEKQPGEKGNSSDDIEEDINKRFDVITSDMLNNQPTTVLPTRVNEFEKAFPRLAKRFPNMKDNFLGKALLKARNFFKNEAQEQVVDKPNNSTKLDATKENTENKRQNELFRDYLKYDVLEVAEKGVEQVRKERIEEKRAKMKKTSEEKSADDSTGR